MLHGVSTRDYRAAAEVVQEVDERPIDRPSYLNNRIFPVLELMYKRFKYLLIEQNSIWAYASSCIPIRPSRNTWRVFIL
jgi:hypothetical protein